MACRVTAAHTLKHKGKEAKTMQEKLIKATLVLSAADVETILSQQVTDRHAVMVEKYGEACTRTVAAKVINVSPDTVAAMLKDGRLRPACGGLRVDVRSLADYIENRGEMDRMARAWRKGKKVYV